MIVSWRAAAMRSPQPHGVGDPVRLWCRAGPRSIGECGIGVMCVGVDWRDVAVARGDARTWWRVVHAPRCVSKPRARGDAPNQITSTPNTTSLLSAVRTERRITSAARPPLDDHGGSKVHAP